MKNYKKIFLQTLFVVFVLINFVEMGNANIAKVDSNFDGKMDQWRHTTPEGKITKIEYDTNFDGTVDQVEHFHGEK